MKIVAFITKTRLYNFDLLNPTLYIEKTGVYRGIHYFLISAQNINRNFSCALNYLIEGGVYDDNSGIIFSSSPEKHML